MPATMPVLNEADVQAHCENGVLFVAFAGTLTGRTNARTADWVDQLRQVVPAESLRGVVFDFRSVIRFRRDNLYTALNAEDEASPVSVHAIPTALLVTNYYQRQMIDVMLMMSAEPERKQVVESMDEALAFIEGWHK